MNLEVRGIENAQDLESERLVLKAKVDLDVGRYVVLRVRTVDERLVAGGNVEAAYWIPDKKVKAGDFIVIYSKSGSSSEKLSTDGKTASHFFYWGASQPRWTPGTAAAIIEAATWALTRP